MVFAFSGILCDPINTHLKHFYLIIPPLTINYIEYILIAKDKMSKKLSFASKTSTLTSNEAGFTDDGFAIGLAYILKLLNQSSNFNSLYWFKSVRQKYMNELNDLYNYKKQQQSDHLNKLTENENEKLQQTLSLSEKRIKTFMNEFDLLYCNICSAKNFFQ